MTLDSEYPYQEVQIAWPFVIGGAVLFCLLLLLAVRLDQPIAAAAALILALILMFFSSMKTIVTDRQLEIRFGPLPLITRTVALREIGSASIARAKWWNGWGIRRISHGWLYNTLSLNVVELQLLRDGRIQIGTVDPERLRDAIMGSSAALPAAMSGFNNGH